MAKTHVRSVRKAKEEQGDRGLDALNTLRIVVPDYLHEYILLDQNVFINNAEKRLFAFASDVSLQILGEVREIAIDGTFDVCTFKFFFHLNCFQI